jgi:xanthine dehydrogenase accessory factor
METADSGVIETALSWLKAGEPVTLVTLAATYGSAPRPAGSLLALRGRGDMLTGSVSGGCVEQQLLLRLKEGALALQGLGLLRIGDDPDEASRLRLPCGGYMDLVLEPLRDPGSLTPIADALKRREPIGRCPDLGSGTIRLAPADREATLSWDGRQLSKVFGPDWRLLLIGACDVAAYVTQMAAALDYEVICCDPCEEYPTEWQQNEARLDRLWPRPPQAP